MSAKKQQFDQNSAFAKSFKSPLFLALAVCLSVIFIAVIITALSLGDLAVATVLALIFSGVSTLCAWLLYGTAVTKGKLIGLRLYLAYRKIMNTFAIIFVSILGAILVGGCIVLGLMSDMIKTEVIPMLESDVKPMLEELVSSSEMAEEEIGDFEEAFRDMPQELKDMYGLESAEDFKEMLSNVKTFAQGALDAWDDIIKVLETDFMSIAIIVAVVYVLVVVAMVFISSSLKRTSKYIRALAEGGNRKAPFIVSFIGGGFAAIGAVILLVTGVSIPMGLSALVTAATVIVFAIFFKEMKEAKEQEALAAAAADAVVVEEAPVVEAPVEEAPVEEAPVEEAPVEEAPVEEAPVEETPVEEAPVEEVPVEE